MKRLTKEGIAVLANGIADILEETGYAGDTRIYFNNRCIDFDSGTYEYEEDIVPTFKREVIENINPLDYFEWAAHNHIISMSFEGPLYDYIYQFFEMPKRIEDILKKVGLYWELGDQWNLTMFPISDDMEIEYTVYGKKPEPMYIFRGCRERMGKEYPEKFDEIMEVWYNLSKSEGDKGCCVIGQKMCFTYDGIDYEMCPPSPWQGEGSWTPFVKLIEKILENLGATNIYYNCGHLD